MIGYTRPIRFILLYFYWFILSNLICLMSARRIAAIARRVAQQVVDGEQEVKQVDSSLGSTSIVLAAPVILAPNTTNQGTDYYQRFGLETKSMNLSCHFRLTLNTAAGATAQIVRFLAVIDKEQAGTGLLLTGALGTSLFAGAGPPTVEQHRSALSQSRYRVLADRVFTVSSGDRSQMEVQWFHRLWTQTHYLDAGTATSSHGPNFVYYIWICNDAASGPNVIVHSRYTFTDS